MSNFMKTAESSPNRYKILWEKEKLLVMSNFSFSTVFSKETYLHTRKNQGLFGKRLIIITLPLNQTITFFKAYEDVKSMLLEQEFLSLIE